MKRILFTIAAAALSTSAAAQAGTINFVSDNANSTEHLASYEGSMTYDSSLSLLTVVLTNTSTGVDAALLTGLAFNINGDATATYLDANNPLSAGFDESAFDDTGSASASPFGTFDAGAALGGDWLGGGSPNGGLAIGDTGIFTFNISGLDAATLDVNDFFSTDGGETEYSFVARFRGIEPGGQSDKVPASITPGVHVIPLPPAAWSGLGMIAVAGICKGRRKLKALLA